MGAIGALTCLSWSWCMAAQSGAAADYAAWDEALGGWEVGTRITHVILLEDHRGERDNPPENPSFVGTVTKLNDEQDYLPYKFYVQYRLQPYLAIGVALDRFGAEAFDEGRRDEEGNLVEGTSGADGTTWLTGPLLYVSGRYLNDTMFTPYGELGLAHYFASFEESSGWGSSKAFELDDPTGVYGAIGCEARFDGHWSADLYGRYMNVDVDGVYTVNGRERGDILFTMSNLTLGIGAKYTF